MFDRYDICPRSLDVTVRHTEQRAPTDESVRLLKELEAAARAKVVESMRLDNNVVTVVVHRWEDMMDLKMRFAIHYSGNGTKREVKLALDHKHGGGRYATIQGYLDEIHKALCDDLAAAIIGAVKWPVP